MEKSVIISKYIQELKNELFQEIHEMFKHRNRPTSKRWLKPNEVVKLLGISHSTLQKMRAKGTLPYSKVGGLLYYDYNDIVKILEKNKIYSTI